MVFGIGSGGGITPLHTPINKPQPINTGTVRGGNTPGGGLVWQQTVTKGGARVALGGTITFDQQNKDLFPSGKLPMPPSGVSGEAWSNLISGAGQLKETNPDAAKALGALLSNPKTTPEHLLGFINNLSPTESNRSLNSAAADLGAHGMF